MKTTSNNVKNNYVKRGQQFEQYIVNLFKQLNYDTVWYGKLSGSARYYKNLPSYDVKLIINNNSHLKIECKTTSSNTYIRMPRSQMESDFVLIYNINNSSLYLYDMEKLKLKYKFEEKIDFYHLDLRQSIKLKTIDKNEIFN